MCTCTVLYDVLYVLRYHCKACGCPRMKMLYLSFIRHIHKERYKQINEKSIVITYTFFYMLLHFDLTVPGETGSLCFFRREVNYIHAEVIYSNVYITHVT